MMRQSFFVTTFLTAFFAASPMVSAQSSNDNQKYVAEEIFNAAKNGATGDELKKAFEQAKNGLAWKDKGDTGVDVAAPGSVEDERRNRRVLGAFDKDGFTPLHWAAFYGNKDTLKELLNSGGNVNAVSGEGVGLLHVAAQGGHVDTLELLAHRGANINQQTQFGRSPLHQAARHGQIEAYKKLIELGADPTATNKNGETAIQNAVLSGQTDLVLSLIDEGVIDACKSHNEVAAAVEKLNSENQQFSDREKTVRENREKLEAAAEDADRQLAAARLEAQKANDELASAVQEHQSVVAQQAAARDTLDKAKKLNAELVKASAGGLCGSRKVGQFPQGNTGSGNSHGF